MSWSPCSVCRSVGACDNYDISVGVTHPTFPVIGAAIAVRRIPVARQYDLYVHFGGAAHYPVEIIHLKPEQHAIAVRLVCRIANAAMVVFDLGAVAR